MADRNHLLGILRRVRKTPQHEMTVGDMEQVLKALGISLVANMEGHGRPMGRLAELSVMKLEQAVDETEDEAAAYLIGAGS